MNKFNGTLQKMAVELIDGQAYYTLRDVTNAERLPLNPFLGQSITLKFTGNIFCISCQRKTNKSFSQGYCFPCMRSKAACDMCIMKPELCHFAKGTCREPDWAERHCLIPHIVYLANSSGLKVGITRENQVPTRWLDQGAIQAVPICRVQERYHSGLIEEVFKQFVADKTNWRAMLKGEVVPLDLAAKRDALLGQAQDQLAALQLDGVELLQENITEITYPVLQYPVKVASLNFDKTPEISGVLLGIKGQYLILDTGVLNIRKFGGYEVEVL